MPTYDYFCKSCETLKAEWHTISNRPESITCQECGGRCERYIDGGQGFQLKGHGWGFDRYAGKSNFSNNGRDSDDS